MNLTFKASQAFEFIQQLLDNNSNEDLWNKYFFAKIGVDSAGHISIEATIIFQKHEDFWDFKRNFNFPYLSVCTLNDDLIIDIRTADEYLSACTDKDRSVLFYEDYTDFVFLKQKPTQLHERMLEQMGFNYVLIPNS